MSKNENELGVRKNEINWYPGHMAKTKRLIKENINFIDVVYEVVDARIPYSSKIEDIDDYVYNKPKILIMTKYDLCDKEQTQKWASFYEEKGYNVILMDLMNKPNISKLLNMTEKVMESVNAERINNGMSKRKTRVLVVGIPNVGKSTLINRLAGKKSVVTGNKPGVTKNLSWIRINNYVELLDTPGILWPRLNDKSFNLAAFTAIKEDVLPLYDVCEYILRMLERYYPKILSERYGIFKLHDDIIEDIEVVGKKRGCVIRGGEIDYDKAINVIIGDIKQGSIKGITFDRRN